MRHAVCALATLALALFAALVPANAQPSGGFATRARNAILVDVKTGSVLFQKDADQLVPPASMSKLMTLAVVFRQLKLGHITLETEFKTSEHAWRTGGAPSRTAAMFIPIHNKTKVAELIQGITVQSGNDAAITLAEGIAGSEQKFAQLMETEARRIGLPKSTFRNPTGLPNPDHLMSARELAALARHIVREYPEYLHYFSQKRFNYRRHKFYNRNRLLGKSGIDGMKTGYTKAAGYGLVVTAQPKGGRRLVGVVMGFEKHKIRNSDALRMITWGQRSLSSVTLYKEGETVGSARVWGGEDFYVPLVGDGDVEVILPRYPLDQRLRGKIIYQGPLKPPVKRGDQVATLRVVSVTKGSPEPIATSETPLYAASDVEPAGFVWRGIDSLLHLALRLANL